METTSDKKNVLSILSESFRASGHASTPERKKAHDFLLEKGLPTAKTEEYRFTPVVRAIEGKFSFSKPQPPVITDSLLLLTDLLCNVVAFVNGEYSPDHSRILEKEPLTLTLRESSGAAPDQDPFDLLNQVFHTQLVELAIPGKTKLQHPVAVVHYFDSPQFVLANPRWLLQLGEESQATVLEYTLIKNNTACFNNKQSRIEIGKRATLEFVTIQQGGGEEVAVNNAQVYLADASKAMCYTCTLEGKLIRNNLTLILDGEGVDAHLHGLYLVSGNRLVDNHTVVDHRKPNSRSNELYKGVMDENGKAVFNGKIFVRPDAQKTNAFQSNRNILLSESANIHTKPQLEIWADDVKCSHGCTTGQLDEEALFYLRSRGIPMDTARGLLLNAFGSETLEGIQDEQIKIFLESLILRKLRPGETS